MKSTFYLESLQAVSPEYAEKIRQNCIASSPGDAQPTIEGVAGSAVAHFAVVAEIQ